jgi:hypothetical protein
MSLLSHQLRLKRYQRELGLDSRTFNALDVKHNDINLLKQLQLLNPVIAVPASAPAAEPSPPENTGFYGSLDITPEVSAGTYAKDIYARLYYINTPLTNEITVRHPYTQQLTVNIADRLPDREAILTLRIRFEAGVLNVDLDAYDGFEPQGLTTNPLTENNYLSMLVDEGNLDEGILSMTLVTTTPE